MILQLRVQKKSVSYTHLTGDKWIEEFACINIFEEIFNDFGIHVLSDYNTATAEYNFIPVSYTHLGREADCECLLYFIKKGT